MDFFWFLMRFFLLNSFIDDPQGGAPSGQSGDAPQDPSQAQQTQQTQQTQQGQVDPQTQDPQGQTQTKDADTRIKELEAEVSRLKQESQQAQQDKEIQLLIEQTKAEIQEVEAKFPEWNNAEQRRTVEAMAEAQKNGNILGERYKGVAGAYLFWKERLSGNPLPNGNSSGYTPSEEDKKLIKKAGSGTPLTQEERIKILSLVKGV